MKSNLFAHVRGLICFTLIGATNVILAETTSRPEQDPNPEEKVVELTPFVVTSNGDVGYQAGNTLAATRLNQSLKDTPSSVSVLTAEFLSDIGATDLTSALGYASNVELQLDDNRAAINGNETIQSYQSYRVRGLPASASRNYFAWNLPSNTYNLERIEDSRGPNSVLFGIGSPGGVINSSTKQAATGRSFYRGTLSVGRYDSHRETIDLNQTSLNGKLAVRFNAVDEKTNSFRKYAFRETRAGDLTVNYKLGANTEIRAEYEQGKLADNAPRSINLFNRLLPWSNAGRPTFTTRAANPTLGITVLPAAATQPRVTYIDNNAKLITMNGTMLTDSTGDVITDPALSDYSINVGGPSQDRHSQFHAISAFVGHRFGKTTFLELAFNHQDYDFINFDPRGSFDRFYGDPNATYNGGAANPYAGQLMLETTWIRAKTKSDTDSGRLMFSTGYNAGKWGKYNIAVLGEYDKLKTSGTVESESWAGAPYNATPENAVNTVWRRKYVTPGDWSTYYVSGPQHDGLITNMTETVTGRVLSSTWVTLNSANPTRVVDTQKTSMIAGQARYFKDRLIIGGGFRRDSVSSVSVGRKRDPVTNIWIYADDASADASALPTKTDYVGENRTWGAVYHVTPKFSVFYNEANNIGVPNRNALLVPPSGEPGAVKPPAPKGVGKDIGVGFDLLDGRIYARATYYQTSGENQTTTFAPLVRQAKTRILDTLLAAGAITSAEYGIRNLPGVVQGSFAQESDGYEFEVTANVTNTWRLRATWSETKAIQNDTAPEWVAWEKKNTAWLQQFNQNLVGATNGQTVAQEITTVQNEIRIATDADGVNLLGNRRHKVNVFTRIDLPYGWLKGAYVGGGYKHQSKMFIGLDSANNSVYSNSFWRADLLAGYQLKWGNRRSVNFQLNVENVFDERDPLVTRYQDDARTRIQSWVIQPPVTWRFTTSFEF